MLPVQVPDAGEEAVDAVAGLDPRHGVVAPQQPVVGPAGFVVDGLQLAAGRPVEDGEVLGAVEDEALEGAQVVARAPARGVDVHEVVGQGLRVGAGQDRRRRRVRRAGLIA